MNSVPWFELDGDPEPQGKHETTCPNCFLIGNLHLDRCGNCWDGQVETAEPVSEVVDLVGALRTAIEAAKERRAAVAL